MAFKYNRLFWLIFLLFSVVFPCLCGIYYSVPILNDGANFFLNALSHFSNGQFYVENSFDHRARMSVLLLHFIPLNIAYFIFKIKSFASLLHIYCGSLIILPALCCLYSVYLFKKAGKIYFSVFTLLLLIAGIYPVINYGCVESYLGICLLLILFQYYLLNIKFNLFHKIIFIVLSILLYDIHESVVLFAPILWITYFRCSDKKNFLLKAGIINSVIVFILYNIFAFTPLGPNLLSDHAVEGTMHCFWVPVILQHGILNFHAIFYISVISIFFISLFSKSIRISTILSLLLLAVFLYMYNTHFFYYAFRMYRFINIYMLIVMEIIMIIIVNKDDLIKKASLSLLPLLIVSSVISNMYIIRTGIDTGIIFDKLYQAANKGSYYIKDEPEIFRKFAPPYGGSPNEQLSYSMISLYLHGNNSKTKSLIVGFDEFAYFTPKYCDGTVWVPEGALTIKMKTIFWDLNPYKEHFIETCN